MSPEEKNCGGGVEDFVTEGQQLRLCYSKAVNPVTRQF